MRYYCYRFSLIEQIEKIACNYCILFLYLRVKTNIRIAVLIVLVSKQHLTCINRATSSIRDIGNGGVLGVYSIPAE